MSTHFSIKAALWGLLTASLQHSSVASDPVDWAALTVPEDPPLQYTGGTFYGLGSDNQGACGFSGNGANSLSLPWSSGTTLTVAMNDDQYSVGITCGMCIKFRGTGTGIGTQPIPQTWQYALVDNRCPECAPGSIDLATAGNGRWQVDWVPIPCNVGQSTFFYHVVSPLSNPYYFAFSVSNTRVPLKNVELETDGSWSSLRRDVSNSWNANGGMYKCPLHIRLTSVLGDVIEDWVPSNQGGQGTGQFPVPTPDAAGATAGALPLTPQYPGITSGESGPVPVHWNAPNGTWVTTTTSNPASPGGPVRLPSPEAAPAEASAASAPSPSPPSPYSPTHSNPSPYQSASSAHTSTSSPSIADKGSLAEWAQCGGTYQCTFYCADAAWTNMQCDSGLTCMRYDSTWWQCRPAGQSFSPPTAPPASSYYTPTTPSSSQSSSDSAAASASSGGSLAFGGNIGSSSASSEASSSSGGGSASASATAGRRMLRS
ncbi:TPA: hypothetical protein ACH3X2_001069 [Trebouxia sp. C0005]